MTFPRPQLLPSANFAQAMVALVLVTLGTLGTPLAAQAGGHGVGNDLANCCCVPELEPEPAQPLTGSCCSTLKEAAADEVLASELTKPLSADSAAQDCICAPLPQEPQAPSTLHVPGEFARVALRTRALERALQPVPHGTLPAHRPVFEDLALPAIKNGTRGRLALLSVARI